MLKHKNNIDMNKEDFKILKEYLEQLKIDTGLNKEEAGYLKAMNDLEHLIIPYSSLKLEDKYTQEFEEWLKKFLYNELSEVYWFNEIRCLSKKDMFKEFNKIKDNL